LDGFSTYPTTSALVDFFAGEFSIMCSDYSIWADGFAKFLAVSSVIQALWIMSIPVTLIGVTYLVTQMVVTLFRREKPAPVVEYRWADDAVSPPHANWRRDGPPRARLPR
jgi:hypothetical protein